MAPRDKNLKATVKMVESVIVDLGLSPEDNRLNTEGPAWGLAKGSAEVFIFINPGQGDDKGNYIQCISPVLKLPEHQANKLALFLRLLQINAEGLDGVAFGIKGDTVVLTTGRSTVDLDPSEVREMVLQIGYYADLYDDELVNEYGGKRHSDTAAS